MSAGRCGFGKGAFQTEMLGRVFECLRWGMALRSGGSSHLIGNLALAYHLFAVWGMVFGLAYLGNTAADHQSLEVVGDWGVGLL